MRDARRRSSRARRARRALAGTRPPASGSANQLRAISEQTPARAEAQRARPRDPVREVRVGREGLARERRAGMAEAARVERDAATPAAQREDDRLGCQPGVAHAIEASRCATRARARRDRRARSGPPATGRPGCRSGTPARRRPGSRRRCRSGPARASENASFGTSDGQTSTLRSSQKPKQHDEPTTEPRIAGVFFGRWPSSTQNGIHPAARATRRASPSTYGSVMRSQKCSGPRSAPARQVHARCPPGTASRGALEELRLLGQVAVPDHEVLREEQVHPEDREGEDHLAEVVHARLRDLGASKPGVVAVQHAGERRGGDGREEAAPARSTRRRGSRTRSASSDITWSKAMTRPAERVGEADDRREHAAACARAAVALDLVAAPVGRPAREHALRRGRRRQRAEPRPDRVVAGTSVSSASTGEDREIGREERASVRARPSLPGGERGSRRVDVLAAEEARSTSTKLDRHPRRQRLGDAPDRTGPARADDHERARERRRRAGRARPSRDS